MKLIGINVKLFSVVRLQLHIIFILVIAIENGLLYSTPERLLRVIKSELEDWLLFCCHILTLVSRQHERSDCRQGRKGQTKDMDFSAAQTAELQ